MAGSSGRSIHIYNGSPEMMGNIAALLGGYLLGAIPFAYIVTRVTKGVDIRTVDIGNSGAGSVIRYVGLRAGVLVAIGDIGKGAVAVGLAQVLGAGLFIAFLSGMAAVVGHIWPVYIGFRGGQGVATLIGVFFSLAWVATGLTLLVMGAGLLVNRSKASRRLFLVAAVAAPVLPALVFLTHGSVELVLYTIAGILFIVARNWERLRHPRTITERLLGEFKDT